MATVSETLGCQGCPLRKLKPDMVFVPPQRVDHRRVAVGEGPGETEVQQLRPFCGGAGTWLELIYRKAGIKKDEVNLINTIQCRPSESNVFPTDPAAQAYIDLESARHAVEHCVEHHVIPFLQERVWDRVDLLGNKALESLTGKTEGINKWRGSPMAIPALGSECITVPTFHPAALMRDQTSLPVAINDLCKSLKIPPENYILHPTLEQVQAFRSTEFAFDIEKPKYWVMGSSAPIEMVGLSDRLYHAIVVPVQGPYKAELKRIFRDARNIVGHNSLQYDLPELENIGITTGPECQHWDTMLLQHLRFPDLPHDLEFVGSQFSGKPAWKAEKGNFELYNARDVDVTFQAYRQLKPMVQQSGLMELYQNVQVPLAKICKYMSDKGIKVNPARIGEVREKIKKELEVEEKFLPEHLRTQNIKINKRRKAPSGTLGKSGRPVKYITELVDSTEVPWASPVRVGKWLHEELGLEPIPDLKTGRPSTGKIALDKHYNRTKNRAIRAVKNLKKMNSLLTLFCKEDMLKATTIHSHFNVHGTASGRLSSSDPNLQNITEAARCIYVPRHEGWSIIEADYSGIENRLTAYFANDHARMERFLSIPDYSEHKHAASVFFNIPYCEVVKDNDKEAAYGKAKRIVHGSNYGMGAKKISMMYDMDFGETKRLLDLWKKELQPTVQWQNRLAEQAKREGFLSTPFGRKRWFYTTSYYTESLSFLPQSAAADVIFRSMLGLLYERIGWPLETTQKVVQYVEPLPQPCNLLLQVHDSLVLECPNEMVPQVVGCLKRVMEQSWPELGGLVLPIGVAVGPSWGETETYTGAIV